VSVVGAVAFAALVALALRLQPSHRAQSHYRHCYGAGAASDVPWVLFRLRQPTLPRQLGKSV
jgi:hypothetical protein